MGANLVGPQTGFLGSLQSQSPLAVAPTSGEKTQVAGAAAHVPGAPWTLALPRRPPPGCSPAPALPLRGFVLFFNLLRSPKLMLLGFSSCL